MYAPARWTSSLIPRLGGDMESQLSIKQACQIICEVGAHADLSTAADGAEFDREDHANRIRAAAVALVVMIAEARNDEGREGLVDRLVVEGAA
jgi:hypothetical protein